MYEFQSYSTVEQNGDALCGETGENPKPKTPNPKRQTRTSSNMPPPSAAQRPAAAGRPATARSLLPAVRRRPLTPAVRRDKPSVLHERTRPRTAKR